MRLSVLLLMVALSGCANLSNEVPSKLSIENFGVYFDDERALKTEFDENSTSGRKITSDPSIVCQTTDIPMEIGISFGIRYKILYPESYGIESVEVETHHPEIIGYDRAASSVDYWESRISHYENGGFVGGAQFQFEEEYELKPGEWKIVVKHKNEQIEKKFMVKNNNRINTQSCKKI